MVVADLKAPTKAVRHPSNDPRSLVARIFPLAGLVAMSVYVFLLSAAMLPSPRVLLPLLLLVALIGWLMWRSFVKVYSKAQFALQETLSQTPVHRVDHATAHAPPESLLQDANLEKAGVTSGSIAEGKLIRELALRSITGASIVGIERASGNIINPGPDEDIQRGDRLLLLGTAKQLASARALLQGPVDPSA